MGCCFGKGDQELPPAFDPVIGLSEKPKAGGIEVTGTTISGTGSIFGDSPVLQVRAGDGTASFAVGAVAEGAHVAGCADR